MEGQDDKFFRRRALSEAGITYSAGAALPVFAGLILGIAAALIAGEGYAETDAYRFLSYLLPQLCFAAAALLFFRRSSLPVRAVYRGCPARYFLLAIVLQFGLMFSLSELNTSFVSLLERFGYRDSSVMLPSLEGWNLLPAFLIIAVLPALMEETLFRGILAGRMHDAGWGTAPLVLISGALFSLFHGNPAQTLYQFACGVCYALVAVRAGSVFPTMAAHFCNNAAVLILTATGYQAEGGWTMPQGAYIAVLVVSALCLAGALVYLICFDRRGAQKGGVREGKTFFFAAAVGIAVCAVEWIVVLVTGFTGG